MEAEGYKCENCKKNTGLSKSLSIFRFPQVLVIHLKRFYNSTTRREKLNTTVKIPLTLDLAPYAPFLSKLVM